ncbi:hypothetical protein [Methanimicrococcus hongohii]|uniref:hypothetical protein n=1 Tax=Methanimicrococcus hongohii TaxID=3028295 RepID=UPI00292E10E7|nr:hypothetical protein [Methanimicrococcus sp. Hf6]
MLLSLLQSLQVCNCLLVCRLQSGFCFHMESGFCLRGEGGVCLPLLPTGFCFCLPIRFPLGSSTSPPRANRTNFKKDLKMNCMI